MKKLLLSFGLSLTILGVNLLPVLAQNRSALETAIKNALGNYGDYWGWGNTEYFSSEIDLNQDGRKEVIVQLFSIGTPLCGAWECPVLIFRASNNSYNLIRRNRSNVL